MRSLKELLKLPAEELTAKEAEYLMKYNRLKRVKHSPSFVYHSRKLPEESKEPDGTIDKH